MKGPEGFSLGPLLSETININSSFGVDLRKLFRRETAVHSSILMFRLSHYPIVRQPRPSAFAELEVAWHFVLRPCPAPETSHPIPLIDGVSNMAVCQHPALWHLSWHPCAAVPHKVAGFCRHGHSPSLGRLSVNATTISFSNFRQSLTYIGWQVWVAGFSIISGRCP
jgi:hypothetical protein